MSAFPSVPPQIKDQFESGKPFDIEGPVVEDAEQLKRAAQELLGSVFCIATHLIEKNVVSLKDLELGIRTALVWPKGPVTMMNGMGMEEAARVVALNVEKNNFKMPATFAKGVPVAWQL